MLRPIVVGVEQSGVFIYQETNVTFSLSSFLLIPYNHCSSVVVLVSSYGYTYIQNKY